MSRSIASRIANLENCMERFEAPPAAFVLMENCNSERPIPDDSGMAQMRPGESFADACARYGVDPKKQPVVRLRVNDMSVPRPD